MGLEIFKHLTRLSPSEFNNPDRLDDGLLIRVDKMIIEESKRISGLIFIPTSDFRLDDLKWHGKGKALDGYFKIRGGWVLPIIWQFFIVLRYSFSGIGFYPYTDPPVVHMDTRPMVETGRRALWWRDGEGRYRNVNDYFAGR